MSKLVVIRKWTIGGSLVERVLEIAETFEGDGRLSGSEGEEKSRGYKVNGAIGLRLLSQLLIEHAVHVRTTGGNLQINPLVFWEGLERKGESGRSVETLHSTSSQEFEFEPLRGGVRGPFVQSDRSELT